MKEEIKELIEKIKNISSVEEVLKNEELLIETTRKYFGFYDLDYFFVRRGNMVEDYMGKINDHSWRYMTIDGDFEKTINNKTTIIYCRNKHEHKGKLYADNQVYGIDEFLIQKCIKDLVNGLNKIIIKENEEVSTDLYKDTIKELSRRIKSAMCNADYGIEQLEADQRITKREGVILKRLETLKNKSKITLSILNDFIDNENLNKQNVLKTLESLLGDDELDVIINVMDEENLSAKLVTLTDRLTYKLLNALYSR